MKKNVLFVGLTILLVLVCPTCCFLTPRPVLAFQPDILPDARVGTLYKVDILITGNVTPVDNYSISDGALPPGLALVMDEQHSLRIIGTPAAAGTFQFTMRVSCYGTNVSGQTGEKQYTLVVGE